MTAPDLSRLGTVRTDWTLDEARAIFTAPFSDLLFHAQRVHRDHFVPNRCRSARCISIKTGACPEDCSYCPQSVRYDTGLEREELMEVGDVVERGAGGQGQRRDALLHGRRLPQPEAAAARSRSSVMVQRGPRAGPRDLRHARHAHAGSRRAS